MDNQLEGLLVAIMNLFADKFGKRAILRGGMVLRLLESARLTNDLDYLLVPFKSKKDVVEEVIETLNLLNGVSVEHVLNSKCLRCIIKKESLVVQVEIKVDLGCRVNVISTAPLAKIHNQTARLINVIAFDIAFANKIAAWYERRLYRDIYDIYLFLNMGVKPDLQTLTKRLAKPEFARNVTEKLDHNSVDALFAFLKGKVENLNLETMTQELQNILPEEELLGLEMRIKNVILQKL